MRFASKQFVTASIDHVGLVAPIELGGVVTVRAYVFNTGPTSPDVRVDVAAENPRTGRSRDATTSFLPFVAIDERGPPSTVPELVRGTDAERGHREEAVEKRETQLADLLARLEG